MILLNMPEHAGVLPLREVLEDQQFYYIVMEKAPDSMLEERCCRPPGARCLKACSRSSRWGQESKACES